MLFKPFSLIKDGYSQMTAFFMLLGGMGCLFGFGLSILDETSFVRGAVLEKGQVIRLDAYVNPKPHGRSRVFQPKEGSISYRPEVAIFKDDKGWVDIGYLESLADLGFSYSVGNSTDGITAESI